MQKTHIRGYFYKKKLIDISGAIEISFVESIKFVLNLGFFDIQMEGNPG